MTKTVLNALGETLYYSGTSKAWISATGAGTALSGTAAHGKPASSMLRHKLVGQMPFSRSLMTSRVALASKRRAAVSINICRVSLPLSAPITIVASSPDAKAAGDDAA